MASSSKTKADVTALSNQLKGLASGAKALGINTAKSDAMVAQTEKQGSRAYKGSSYDKGQVDTTPVVNATTIGTQKQATIPDFVPQTVPVDITANQTAMTGTGAGTTTADPYAGLTAAQDAYTKAMEKIVPASAEDIQRKLEKDTQIAQKEQAVNNLTGQVNTIVANSQAEQLKLEATGRGQTTGFIGGEQARINREAAIAALPIQAQLAQAQGNLELAQQHINTWGKIMMTDAENTYNRKKSAADSVFEFATKIQGLKIQDALKKAEIAREDAKALVNTKMSALSNALGQGAPSSVQFAIQNAKTQEEAIAAAGIYNGDLLGMEAKRASIRASNASTANSYSEIEQRNIAQNGTLNGKPQTEGQLKVQGYVDRMATSDAIINEIGSKFAAYNAIGGLLPSMIQSADRQRFEQAKLNFVNAKLRQESGAVIGDPEFKKADLQYFPQAGDSPEVLAQKSANRTQVISGGYREANVAAPTVSTSTSTASGKAFDIEGARAAGYSQQEIDDYIKNN